MPCRLFSNCGEWGYALDVASRLHLWSTGSGVHRLQELQPVGTVVVTLGFRAPAQ